MTKQQSTLAVFQEEEKVVWMLKLVTMTLNQLPRSHPMAFFYHNGMNYSLIAPPQKSPVTTVREPVV